MSIPNIEMEYGPTLPISEEIHAMKYRSKGETFKEAMTRVAEALKRQRSTLPELPCLF